MSLPLETLTTEQKLGIRATLGLGTADTPTFRGLALVRDGSNSIAAAVGASGSFIWTYVGTGSTLIHNANRAGTFTSEVRNSSTEGNANAANAVTTLGTGDAFTRYTVPALSWVAGIDNSDGDKFKIGVGATVNLATWFEIAVTGESRFFGSADVQRTSDNANFERVGMRWDGLDAKIGTSRGGTGGSRDLALETGGSERARILGTNGNLGLGTQSPTQRLDVVGSIKASQPIFCPNYMVAQLQALTASAYTGAVAYCNDEAGGPTLVFCDGTNWRRVQDRAIISLPA